MHKNIYFGVREAHLLIQPVAKLGYAALDFIELAALLLAVAFYDIHHDLYGLAVPLLI